MPTSEHWKANYTPEPRSKDAGSDCAEAPGSAPTVETAAIMEPSGKVWTLPRPARHHTIISHMIENGYPRPVGGDCEQGFVLSDGRFVCRKPAARLAIRAGQIQQLKWPPYLYSEDLW